MDFKIIKNRENGVRFQGPQKVNQNLTVFFQFTLQYRRHNPYNYTNIDRFIIRTWLTGNTLIFAICFTSLTIYTGISKAQPIFSRYHHTFTQFSTCTPHWNLKGTIQDHPYISNLFAIFTKLWNFSGTKHNFKFPHRLHNLWDPKCTTFIPTASS